MGQLIMVYDPAEHRAASAAAMPSGNMGLLIVLFGEKHVSTHVDSSQKKKTVADFNGEQMVPAEDPESRKRLALLGT